MEVFVVSVDHTESELPTGMRKTVSPRHGSPLVERGTNRRIDLCLTGCALAMSDATQSRGLCCIGG